MAELSFVILAHEPAAHVSRLINVLIGADETSTIVVHYDGTAPATEFAKLQKEFAGSERVWLVEDRVRCGWGEFGLVDGVVKALRLLRQHEVHSDRVYLLSGSCMPVRPIAQLKRFLDAHPGVEFIEANPPEWIVGGLRTERFEYHHFVNERNHRDWFYFSFEVQRLLGLKRKFPAGLTPRFGSQWWCLTWHTCETILRYIDENPKSYRYFRTTWIPDELFFQTMVYSLAPQSVFGRSLTYFRFTNQGKPIVLYDDHVETARKLPFFFARKIGPKAERLRTALTEIAQSRDDGSPLPIVGDPLTDFDFYPAVARQVRNPVVGQMFYGNQMLDGWPSSMSTSTKRFVVLYGPTVITDRVRDALAATPGFTVFGRLFAPKRVDLGPSGPVFHGLSETDWRLRDMDEPLFLARLLERCTDGLPVFQMVPGEARKVEGGLHFLENALFVACTPTGLVEMHVNDGAKSERLWRRRNDWRRLFWALSARDFLEIHPLLEEAAIAAGGDKARKVVDDYISAVEGEHPDWIDPRIVRAERADRVLHLRWGREGIEFLTHVRRLDGQELDKLTMNAGDIYDGLVDALANLRPMMEGLTAEEVLSPLPPRWRRFFAPLFVPDDQRVSATLLARSAAGIGTESKVLEDAPRRCVVLYGPTALTDPIRDRLAQTPGFAVFGRLFAPKFIDLGPSTTRFRSLPATAAAVRNADESAFLQALFSGCEGMPVFQLVPGENRKAEGMLHYLETALYLVCGPAGLVRVPTKPGTDPVFESRLNHRREDWLRFFWSLSAFDLVEVPPLLDEEEGRLGGRRLRRVIDDFVGSQFNDHPGWINPRVLTADHADRVVHLHFGPEATAFATQLKGAVDREIEQLTWLFGAEYDVLVKHLPDLQREAAGLDLEPAVVELPMLFQMLFDPLLAADRQTLLEPSTSIRSRAEGWPGALADVSRRIVVLYGPTVATTPVRDALVAAGGFEGFGRVFARDRIDLGPAAMRFPKLDVTRTRQRDADVPLFLKTLVEKSEGMPVLQIVPGEAPGIETAMTELDNVVVMVCSPAGATPIPAFADDPGLTRRLSYRKEDWSRLFWALSAQDLAPDHPLLADVEAAQGGRKGRAVIDAFVAAVTGPHREWADLHLIDAETADRVVHLRWGPDVEAFAPLLAGPEAIEREHLSWILGSDAGDILAVLPVLRRAAAACGDLTVSLPQSWQRIFAPLSVVDFEEAVRRALADVEAVEEVSP